MRRKILNFMKWLCGSSKIEANTEEYQKTLEKIKKEIHYYGQIYMSDLASIHKKFSVSIIRYYYAKLKDFGVEMKVKEIKSNGYVLNLYDNKIEN
jgi:hypothetical protein